MQGGHLADQVGCREFSWQIIVQEDNIRVELLVLIEQLVGRIADTHIEEMLVLIQLCIGRESDQHVRKHRAVFGCRSRLCVFGNE